MRILVACEESQTVTKAFRAKGHEAYSCDIQPCSGGKPQWHYHKSLYELPKEHWDMMIAHPPCTYLTVAANRSFVNNPERWQHRVDALNFVWMLMNANIDKICIENPKGVIGSHIKHPDFTIQYIQPYWFGHKDSKMTGLWLKNLEPLEATNMVEPEWVYPKSGTGKRMSKTHANNPGNAKLRSKTYQGIADAMADKWG